MHEPTTMPVPVTCPHCQQQVTLVFTITGVHPDEAAHALGLASYTIAATCYDEEPLRQHLARHAQAAKSTGPTHCAGCGMVIERAGPGANRSVSEWRHKGTGFAYCWPGETDMGVAAP